MLTLAAAVAVAADAVRVSPARQKNGDVLVHEVVSPYQAGTTKIRVLLPAGFDSQRSYPIIYVLPVEAGEEHRYGDGLAEISTQTLVEKYPAIYVTPTFSQLPWYADHPNDPTVRQESYLLKVVVPFIDETYQPKVENRRRLLVGFSKSGWGAWSLLLRNPEVFERAAAWDAPLAMDQPGRYGSGPIFGDAATFERYQIWRLLRTRAQHLQQRNCLVLLGWESFRPDLVTTHELLAELKIPHVYRDGPRRKHDWHSGWVGDALPLLLRGESK